MSEKHALPEQFHRSRLTSMSMSILALAASIVHPNQFNKSQLFSFPVGDMGQPFIITVLTLAAFISLASLWLAYLNDGQEFLRRRLEVTKSFETPQEIFAALDKACEDINMIRQSSSNIDQEERYNIIKDNLAIDQRPIEDLVLKLCSEDLRGWVIERLNYIKREFGAFEYNFVRENSYNYLINEAAALEQERTLFACEAFPQSSHTMTTASSQLLFSMDRIKAESSMINQRIENIRKILVSYRWAAKSATASNKLEITVIGVWVPTGLFIVALAHAIGALKSGALWTLPYIVNWMLG